MSLDTCLQHLTEEGSPLSHGVLQELSGLSPAELGRLARTWYKLSPERRQKIVVQLAEMAEEDPELDFSPVFKLGLKDSHEEVRQAAVAGLWEFEDRSLIPGLVWMVRDDESGKVRAAAAVALGKFASLAQDGKILPRDGDVVRGCLMEALGDEEEWLEVRRRALEAVAPFSTRDINKYVRWAYDSDDLNLKCSSIYAMGRTGEPQWMPVLVRELQNPNPPIRYEAANACGVMDEEEMAPHLIPLLLDDDLHVQLAAIAALGGIGGQLAKKALRRCLSQGDPALEEAVKDALENIQVVEDPLGFSYER